MKNFDSGEVVLHSYDNIKDHFLVRSLESPTDFIGKGPTAGKRRKIAGHEQHRDQVGIVNEHVYNEKDSTIRGKNQLKRDRSQEINLYEVPARTEGIKIETPLIIEKSYRTLEHAYGLTKDKSNLPNSKGHIGPTDYQVMKTNEFVKDKNALKNCKTFNAQALSENEKSSKLATMKSLAHGVELKREKRSENEIETQVEVQEMVGSSTTSGTKSIPFLRDTRHELYDTNEKDLQETLNQTRNFTQNFMEEESAYFLRKS